MIQITHSGAVLATGKSPESRLGGRRMRFGPQSPILVAAALCVLASPALGDTRNIVHVSESAPAIVSGSWAEARRVDGREAPGFVAFTFDDGPDLRRTPAILATLERFGVPATFFVVGRHFAKNTVAARAGAKLLVDLETRGFTIGNHTTNHQNLSTIGAKEAIAAVKKNAADLAKLLGHDVHLFRPPYGQTTASIRRLLHRRGDTMVRWNVDSQDFMKGGRKKIADRVLADILRKGGGVVLLHDTKKWTVSALPRLLRNLEQANCERLAAGKIPILPVSLHYFLRDQNGSPRTIPDDIVQKTQGTMTRLRQRCQSPIDKVSSAD